MTLLFAAGYPERVRALILYAPIAKTVRSPEWPFGVTEDEQQAFTERLVAEMGSGDNLDLQGPTYDARLKRWWAHFERLVATPSGYRELMQILTSLDVSHVLPLIQAPTLVLHRTDDRIVPIVQGRAVAQRIPGARLVELSGVDHIPWLGDQEAIIGEVAEFLTGARPAPNRERVLATVLFTDIVASTELAATLGDRRWTDLLAEHRDVVRRRLVDFRGVERDTAGDGFMATFDGPARAIRCAQAIVEDVRGMGVEVRAGIHAGECELLESGIGGIAVHIAARVIAVAGAGEVCVSSTVRELVAGSGVGFADLGTHTLKGVPEPWRLFRVES